MSAAPSHASRPYDVVVLGAGYAGLMAALRLSQRRLGLRVALVNADEAFVERIRLQEAMVAPVKPRIASLSAYLAGTPVEFIRARVTGLDPDGRRVRIEAEGGPRELEFSQAIYALGSHVDTEPVPGVAEHAYRLDPGEGPRSAATLRTALTAGADRPLQVLAIGGGALSIEAAGEVKSVWPGMQVTLVSGTRAGDFAGEKVEAVLRHDLARLGVQLLDHERIDEVRATEVITGSGRRLPYDICIWAGGMRAAPIAKAAGLTVDPHDRILVGPDMRSVSHPHIIAAGDSAAPLAPTGAPYRLAALTAAVSGVYAGEQAAAGRSGRRPPPFSFSTFAQAVAVGRYAALFPLDPNDRQVLFVLGGRTARRLRDALVWLVLHFITLERHFPGLQSWPGRTRVTQREADAAVRSAAPTAAG
jgi:NADH dehydrogenase FAD-containing subunit